MQQGQGERLQDQGATAGGPDGEFVVASRNLARNETQLCRSSFGMAHGRAADARGRLDRYQMLAHQTRLRAVGADP